MVSPKKKILSFLQIALLALLGLISLLFTIDNIGLIQIKPEIFFICRWLIVIVLMLYSWHKKSLTTWILSSMVVGLCIGYDMPDIAIHLNVVSKIFLRLIKTIIAPLLFATLVVGIAGHSSLKQVGRMGWKSLVYFEIVSTLALFIGLAAINISEAGVGVKLPETVQHIEPVTPQTTEDIILHIFPENIAKAIYEGNILQIVVFSIIFAIAVALLKDVYKQPILKFSESLSQAMFKFTSLVMLFAPFAVCAAIAYSVGHTGIGVLVNLGKLLLTLYAALAVFVLFVLIPIALLYKIPILNFFKAIRSPLSLAFATTSSEAALPLAMERMQQFGVPGKIVAFVLPTGYTFNLDGTTLYLSLATIFIAQTAGIHLNFEQQLVICLTLMLTSKGVAGIPRASLVILMGTVASFGLPVEPIFIILGIDELMDMARTSVNVIGNCLASAVVAKSEKEFDMEKAKGFKVQVEDPLK